MTGLPPEFTLSRSPERSEGETKGRLAPTNVTFRGRLTFTRSLVYLSLRKSAGIGRPACKVHQTRPKVSLCVLCASVVIVTDF